MQVVSAEGNPILWVGRPWIVPALAIRTVAVLIAGLLFLWIELLTGTADAQILGISLLLWTASVLFFVWIVVTVGLLIQRATNLYVLREDSLMIRTGIITHRSYLIVPSGFSDLEVIKGIAGRMFSYGDIVIRSQSERSSERTMAKVRHPLEVAQQVRYIMSRQLVRMQ